MAIFKTLAAAAVAVGIWGDAVIARSCRAGGIRTRWTGSTCPASSISAFDPSTSIIATPTSFSNSTWSSPVLSSPTHGNPTTPLNPTITPQNPVEPEHGCEVQFLKNPSFEEENGQDYNEGDWIYDKQAVQIRESRLSPGIEYPQASDGENYLNVHLVQRTDYVVLYKKVLNVRQGEFYNLKFDYALDPRNQDPDLLCRIEVAADDGAWDTRTLSPSPRLKYEKFSTQIRAIADNMELVIVSSCESTNPAFSYDILLDNVSLRCSTDPEPEPVPCTKILYINGGFEEENTGQSPWYWEAKYSNVIQTQSSASGAIPRARSGDRFAAFEIMYGDDTLRKKLTNLKPLQVYQLKYSFSATGRIAQSDARTGTNVFASDSFEPGRDFQYKGTRALFQPATNNEVLTFGVTIHDPNEKVVVFYDDIEITEWQAPCQPNQSTPARLCGAVEGLPQGFYQEGAGNYDYCVDYCIKDPNCQTIAYVAASSVHGYCYFSSQKQQDLKILPAEDEWGEPMAAAKYYDRNCFTCRSEALPICHE